MLEAEQGAEPIEEFEEVGVGCASLPNPSLQKMGEKGFKFTLWQQVNWPGKSQHQLTYCSHRVVLARAPGSFPRIKKMAQVEGSDVFFREGGVPLPLMTCFGVTAAAVIAGSLLMTALVEKPRITAKRNLQWPDIKSQITGHSVVHASLLLQDMDFHHFT